MMTARQRRRRSRLRAEGRREAAETSSWPRPCRLNTVSVKTAPPSARLMIHAEHRHNREQAVAQHVVDEHAPAGGAPFARAVRT